MIQRPFRAGLYLTELSNLMGSLGEHSGAQNKLTAIVASVVLIASVSVMSVVPMQALGTFPGTNGKITFVTSHGPGVGINIMNPDGTNSHLITNSFTPQAEDPSWSPDGTKIAFVDLYNGGYLYTMNAEGAELTPVKGNPVGTQPSWSPDGTKLAYAARISGINQIMTVDLATGALHQVTSSNTLYSTNPSWSPDGKKIAFERSSQDGSLRDIYIMNSDGTQQVNLTSGNMGYDAYPTWSPDGTKIAFESDKNTGSTVMHDIYVMSSLDGSNLRRLTNSTAISISLGTYPRPSWSPPSSGEPTWSPDGTKIAFVSNVQTEYREVYVMDAATGANVHRLTQINADDGTSINYTVSSPDWAKSAPPPTIVPLTIRSASSDGSSINGYWAVLYDSSGNVVKTGFTPVIFSLNAGQQYKVRMGNYGSYSFDHWVDNDSTANPRSVSINSNTQLTAVYKTSTTYPITHMSDTTASAGYGVHAPKSARAETVSTSSQLIGDKIDSITLKLKRVGTISGTATIGILDASNNVKKTFGTIDVSKLTTTTYTDYEFHLSNNELYTIQAYDFIGIKYAGGDANNWVSVMLDLNSADPFDGANSYQSYFNPSSSPPAWNGDSGRDMYMILNQTHA